MDERLLEKLRALVQEGQISLNAAAKQLGINYQTAYYQALKRGFLRREKPSYAHLYESWRTEYVAGSSIREISLKSGASTMAVRTAIRGLARRVHRTIERPDFFHSIDTEEKAYWLGLLWADGSINDLRKGKRLVQISLTQQDATDPKENELGLIEAFRTALGTDYAIGSRRNRTGTGNVLHLAVLSDQLVDDLIAHGLVPRKGYSKLGEIPAGVPDHLIPAFARGLLDGDGTMYLSTRTHEKTGHVNWTIQPKWTGGYNVLQWMRERFMPTASVPKYGGGTCSMYLAPEGARQAIRAMYANPVPSLRRKREKAMSLISDLHPQDWQDYGEDRTKLPPRVQVPLTPSEAGSRGAAVRWAGIEVIHGDAFKLLPKMEAKSVDLVLTDLPYSKESRDRGRRNWPFDPFTYEKTKKSLELMGRVSRGWVVVATMDIAFIGRLRDDCPKPLRFVRMSTWEKEGYVLPGNAEYIAFFHRRGVNSSWYPPPVFSHKSNGHSGHPTSKPVELYSEIIAATTGEKGSVLDPFCGSGTTGRAAKALGRSAILIDKDEQYVAMAKRVVL